MLQRLPLITICLYQEQTVLMFCSFDTVSVFFSEGSLWDRLCSGRDGSAVMFPVHFLNLDEWRSWKDWKLAPVFSAAPTVRYSLSVFGGRSNSDSDGWRENGLDYCRVELNQHCLRQAELPELVQDVHPQLGMCNDRVYATLSTWRWCTLKTWIVPMVLVSLVVEAVLQH